MPAPERTPPGRRDDRRPASDARRDDRRPASDARRDDRRPAGDNRRPASDAHRDDRRPASDNRRPERDARRDDRRPGSDARSDDRRPERDEPRPEIKVCGVNACQAVAARRPDDVRRVYIHDSLLPAFGAFLKRCAASRIAYHVVEHDELARITQSTHHEGVCFIVRERPTPSLRQLLAGDGPRCLVYLDGVQNPHNLGAIVRVCAHFGAAGVLVAGTDDDLPTVVSTAMLRTAEGGGEWVDVVAVDPGPQPLVAARAAGYRLVATAARGGRDLYAAPLPPRAVILLGSETHGVSPAALRLADDSVRIPGTGHLDSLNVACACSVLLGEYWRTVPRRDSPRPARP